MKIGNDRPSVVVTLLPETWEKAKTNPPPPTVISYVSRSVTQCVGIIYYVAVLFCFLFIFTSSYFRINTVNRKQIETRLAHKSVVKLTSNLKYFEGINVDEIKDNTQV